MKVRKLVSVLAALIILVPVSTATAATKKAQTISWSKVSSVAVGATVAVNAKATSKLAVKVTNATPSICTVTVASLTGLAAGTCTFTLSQAGNKKFKAAKSISASVAVKAGARTTVDQKDTFSGFQLHAIYVQPADVADRSLDTNGFIAGLLDDGNAFLKREIGQTLPIDSTSTGYDIQYLKSKYTASKIMGVLPNQLPSLMNELLPFNTPSENRKDYVFFLDVPALNGNYCGWADNPGMAAVVALGGPTDTQHKCSGTASGFKDYASKTWVHEVFHNLGVSHTATVCDLMYVGSTNCTGAYRADANHNLYVSASSKYGPDVLKERVWTGETANPAFSSPCYISTEDYLRNDATPFVYCPTGTLLIGDIACYQQLTSAVLQKQVDGAWVEVGQGNIVASGWGAGVGVPCTEQGGGKYPQAPSLSITQTTPGVVRFRWVNNKTYPQDPFDVIFAK